MCYFSCPLAVDIFLRLAALVWWVMLWLLVEDGNAAVVAYFAVTVLCLFVGVQMCYVNEFHLC